MAVPAWKLALMQKKQRQEEEEKRIQASKEEYLAKLPPWKRALIAQKEKNPNHVVAKQEVSVTVQRTESADKWEMAAKHMQKVSKVAQPRPNASDAEPETASHSAASAMDAWKKAERQTAMSSWKKPSTTSASGPTPSWKKPATSTEQTPSWKKPATSTEQTPSWKKPATSTEQTPSWKKPATTSEQTPLWKKPATATSEQTPSWKKPATTTSDQTPSWKKPASTNSPTKPEVAGPQDVPASQPQNESTTPSSSVTANSATTTANTELPPWKRRQLQKKEAEKKQQPKSEDDNVPNWMKQLRLKKQQQKQQQSGQKPEPEPEPQPPEPEPVQEKPKPVPEVVNASTKKAEEPVKLVKTEGTTHRAPVLQQSKKWADISVDDPKFKTLPRWQQALILRRQKDLEQRTKPIEEPAPPPPPDPVKEKKADMLLAAWTKKSPHLYGESTEETDGPVKEIKKQTTNTQQPSWAQVKLRKTGNTAVRRPPTPSPPKSPGLESEEEDLECTTIDESDEEDVPQLPKVKSILKRKTTPKRTLRKVSFSDSDLTAEFFYPKYDYSDYDDLDEEWGKFPGARKEEEPDSVSQPVHPWLAAASITSPPPKSSSSSSRNLASSSYAFQDLGSFVSAYAISKEPSSSSVPATQTHQSSSRPEELNSTPDFYANLNTDTAALIW